MKNSLFSFLITFALLISPKLYAQQADFEGVITFKINYIEVPAELRGMQSMLPKDLSMTFKGDLVKIEQKMMGGGQTILVDNEKKEGHVLMDMMGTKMDIFMSREEIEKEELSAQKPSIELLSGSKTILGYSCKKAVLTSAEGDVMDIWYTEQIDAKHREYKELPGFPLEYETSKDGMVLKMEASNIDKSVVDDAVFEVPSGYQQMTMAELQKMMGGN